MDKPLKAFKQPQTKRMEMARTIWMIWSGGSNFIVENQPDILILIPSDSVLAVSEDLRIGPFLEDIWFWRYNMA